MTDQVAEVEPKTTQPMTWNDVVARIEKEMKKAGVTPTSRLSRVSWFSRRSAFEVHQLLVMAPEDQRSLLESLRPTELSVGADCPLGNAGLSSPRKIIEMFDDEDEIRVYAMSPNSSPACLRLSKGSPLFTLREFTLSAFIDELVNEWSELEDDMSTAEKERDAVLDYAATLPPNYSLSEFVQDLRDEVHLEDVEEEEEEEPEASTVPASPSAIAAVNGPGGPARVG